MRLQSAVTPFNAVTKSHYRTTKDFQKILCVSVFQKVRMKFIELRKRLRTVPCTLCPCIKKCWFSEKGFFLQEHFFPNLEICRQKVDSFNRHHSYLEEYFFLFDISVHWTNSQKVMYYLNIDVFYLNHVKSPLQHNSSENLTLCLKDLKCTV